MPALDSLDSRMRYRRRLAHALAVALMRKPHGGRSEFANPAEYVEDFAQAVTERLAAREDKELIDAGQRL